MTLDPIYTWYPQGYSIFLQEPSVEVVEDAWQQAIDGEIEVSDIPIVIAASEE
jgi:hypothetical protein